MSNLTHEDRIKIEALHNARLSASKIANELGKHTSSITRELIERQLSLPVNDNYNCRLNHPNLAWFSL